MSKIRGNPPSLFSKVFSSQFLLFNFVCLIWHFQYYVKAGARFMPRYFFWVYVPLSRVFKLSLTVCPLSLICLNNYSIPSVFLNVLRHIAIEAFKMWRFSVREKVYFLIYCSAFNYVLSLILIPKGQMVQFQVWDLDKI